MESNASVRDESGFSLLEMMMVLAILSVVMAVTMRAINDVQKRSRVEEAKVDLTQESREFVEQMVRDLHQSGYPTSTMYTTAPNVQNNFYAQGITAGDQTSIAFEGDVDGDGVVDLINYQLVSDATVSPAGQCPCILRRSQLQKVDGGPQPAPVYNTEVDQVINSAGGAGAWVVSGSFVVQNTPVVTVQNDTYYGPFKTDPIFRYFNGIGNELVPAAGAFTETPAAAGVCLSPGCAATVADIRSVRIAVSTLARVLDPITRTYPANAMTASARIANR